MNDTEQVYSEDASHEAEEQQTMSRRDYLLSLKKWSKVVIGSVLLGSASSTMLSGCVAWSDSGGGWYDSHYYDDDWTNYRGGTWVNGGGGWLNGGGGWSNGGGGWANRSGGSGAWKNGGGGSSGWKNSGGSGGWKNSGGGSRSGGWANSSSGSRSTSRSSGGGRSR